MVKDSESTQNACVRWFSCENGIFVLVAGIGSLIHLYSLVESQREEPTFKEESMNHRYKKITTVETRGCATPDDLSKGSNCIVLSALYTTDVTEVYGALFTAWSSCESS